MGVNFFNVIISNTQNITINCLKQWYYKEKILKVATEKKRHYTQRTKNGRQRFLIRKNANKITVEQHPESTEGKKMDELGIL